MNTPNKQSILEWLTFSIVCLMAMAMVCMIWLWLTAQPFLRYTNLPFPVRTAVHAGQAAELVVGRCNDDDVVRTYVTSRTLRNMATGEGKLLSDVWLDVPPGCAQTVSHIHKIPVDTPSGKYITSGVSTLQGKNNGNFQVAWSSQPFIILAAESADQAVTAP